MSCPSFQSPPPSHKGKKHSLQDFEKDDNQKRTKITLFGDEPKYMCSLVVITTTSMDDQSVDCCTTYQALNEQDAVREAITSLMGSNFIEYSDYKAIFDSYKSGIVMYKQKCLKEYINNDIELWKDINNKQGLCSSPVMAHVLMIDENDHIDAKLCNEKTYLQRMYTINSFKVLRDIIAELNVHSGSWLRRIIFQSVEMENPINKDILATFVAEKNKDLDHFKKSTTIKRHYQEGQ